MLKKIFLFSAIFIIFIFGADSASAETQVQGEINKNTTWTLANSPYTIVNTIEIAHGKTLTIEPGVVINCPNNYDMFKLIGNIVARGNADKKVVFNGGGNSLFFDLSDSLTITFADLEYAEFRDGTVFWNQGPGYFNLRHSIIENLSRSSYLWYPADEVYIEYNEFINSGGFAIDQSGDSNVYFRYNSFNGLNPGLTKFQDFYIQNKSSYDNSETVVEYNSFMDIDGIALELESGQTRARMSALNNYWGTSSTEVIDAMIYDKNDNPLVAGYIEYQPILDEPSALTPGSEIASSTQETATSTEEAATSTEPSSAPDGATEGEETATSTEAVEEEAGPSSAEATGDKPAGEESGFIEVEKSLVGAVDAGLAARLSGRILLQVEENGEGWYIYPETQKKYYLGRPADAFNIMRELGLGATHEFISTHEIYPNHVLGKILLDVEQNGEAYYINPVDKKAYYLGRPDDAFSIMRELGLGISNSDIRKIEVGEL